MTTELTRLLVEAGLLQFGRFSHDGKETPFLFSFEMLPSYPHVLRAMIEQAKALLSRVRINRILCTADAIPFGISLSLETDIPLVYSRGIKGSPPVRDLVGAYDIGHPVVVVTNIFGSLDPLTQLATDARQVGLEVHIFLAIVDLGIALLPQATQVFSLLRLPDVITKLVDGNQLPSEQGRAVLSWIASQSELGTYLKG